MSATGQPQYIGSLGGTETQPEAINSGGDIAGFGTTTGNVTTHAFLYNGSIMLDLGVLSGTVLSDAFDLNDQDDVVGLCEYNDGSTRAFLYTASGGMQDLNGLIAPAAGWFLESAAAINDHGEITGIGVNPAGQTHAFLLIPTPEPSELALLITAMALATIHAYTKNRRSNAFRR